MVIIRDKVVIAVIVWRIHITCNLEMKFYDLNVMTMTEWLSHDNMYYDWICQPRDLLLLLFWSQNWWSLAVNSFFQSTYVDEEYVCSSIVSTVKERQFVKETVPLCPSQRICDITWKESCPPPDFLGDLWYLYI